MMVPAATSTSMVHAFGYAARPSGRRMALAALLLLAQASSVSPVCIGEGVEYTLTLDDSFGDGWNGAMYTLISDSDGTVAASGTLESGDDDGTAAGGGTPESGATATKLLCLADNACFTFTVGIGEYPSEISWSIDDQDGEEAASGGADTTVGLCVGGATPGPSLTLSPSAGVTVNQVEATTVDELKAYAESNDNIIIDITAAELDLYGSVFINAKTSMTIKSSVGTILNGRGNNRLFYVINSDVTFTGINLHSGSANYEGGCVHVANGATVTMNDVGFLDCHAVRSMGRSLRARRPHLARI